YKQKYLSFRRETNSNFLCLQLVLSNLDEILKELFDFFKDTNENEFESFETKAIKVDTIQDAVRDFINTKGSNVRFKLPEESCQLPILKTEIKLSNLLLLLAC